MPRTLATAGASTDGPAAAGSAQARRLLAEPEVESVQVHSGVAAPFFAPAFGAAFGAGAFGWANTVAAPSAPSQQ